jgi:cyclopropane fatty-acyl-phospholipid synthase-like methyltransferase
LWIRTTRFFITLTPSSTITAVDLSRKQIKFANKQRKNLKIPIKFVQGDALKINKQFHTKFDRIFSIESAFHYNRPLFFNHVNHLLQDDGIFVIIDIMLSNIDLCITTILRVFSDFLFILNTNLISVNEWKKQLQNELTIVET